MPRALAYPLTAMVMIFVVPAALFVGWLRDLLA